MLRAPIGDVKKLIVDLLAYQDQLEEHNEKLRTVQSELKEARDRYLNFFDLAPVGYFAFDPAGQILEVNGAGAVLLGEDKDSLIAQFFQRFVMADSQEVFSSLFTDALKHAKRKYVN